MGKEKNNEGSIVIKRANKDLGYLARAGGSGNVLLGIPVKPTDEDETYRSPLNFGVVRAYLDSRGVNYRPQEGHEGDMLRLESAEAINGVLELFERERRVFGLRGKYLDENQLKEVEAFDREMLDLWEMVRKKVGDSKY